MQKLILQQKDGLFGVQDAGCREENSGSIFCRSCSQRKLQRWIWAFSKDWKKADCMLKTEARATVRKMPFLMMCILRIRIISKTMLRSITSEKSLWKAGSPMTFAWFIWQYIIYSSIVVIFFLLGKN